MTVYVDELRQYPKGPPSLRFGSCHMMADTLEELLAMADRIGMPRHWLQNGSKPHFDLAKKYRAKAVRAGAVEVEAGEFLAGKAERGDSGQGTLASTGPKEDKR